MQNRTVFVFGLIMVAAGVFFLLGNLLQFDPWPLFGPLALIALGVWLLFKPRMTAAGAPSNVLFIGDIKRSGVWQVVGEEFIAFISDIDLDLTQAQVLPGETVVVCSGFIGDVTIITPPGLGIKVSSTAFVTELNFLGSKTTSFLNPTAQATPDYATVERKVHIQARYFIGDVKIKAG